MKARARPFLALLAVLLLLSGCSLAQDSPTRQLVPERDRIRVGVGNPIDTAPLRIAVQQGRFREAGLTVELVEQPSNSEGMAKLAAGELDIAFATDVAWFKAAGAGTPVRLQGEAYTAGKGTMALVTLPDSVLDEPTAVRSPRIAVDTLDDLGTLTTRSVLATAGVQPDRIRFDQYDFGAMADALRGGDVHAAWMVEPYLTTAQKDLGARVLADTARGATLDFPMTSYASTRTFAEQNPRTLELFRTVLGEAQQRGADPTVVRRALPGFAGIDQTTASLVSLGDYPISLNAVRLQRVADLMHSSGLLPRRLDVQSLLPEPNLS